MLNLSSVLIMLCGVAIAAFSQILLKTSANREHTTFWSQYLNKRVILGYGMMVISMLLAVWAYSGMDFKYGPAIESVGMALVAILSCVILKEKMTKKRLAGTILIIVGLIVFCL